VLSGCIFKFVLERVLGDRRGQIKNQRLKSKIEDALPLAEEPCKYTLPCCASRKQHTGINSASLRKKKGRGMRGEGRGMMGER
jgi:hypothetical protein